LSDNQNLSGWSWEFRGYRTGLFNEHTGSDLHLFDLSYSDDQDLSGWRWEFTGYRTGLFDEHTGSDLPLSDLIWSDNQDLSGWRWEFRSYRAGLFDEHTGSDLSLSDPSLTRMSAAIVMEDHFGFRELCRREKHPIWIVLNSRTCCSTWFDSTRLTYAYGQQG
jgi:hypothetical protein